MENEYYYTIIRKYYGLPDYFNKDLSEEEDCFTFDTEQEANKCLELCFDRGNWMNDERHGKIRHFAALRKVRHTIYGYASGF